MADELGVSFVAAPPERPHEDAVIGAIFSRKRLVAEVQTRRDPG
jgi:hypothetical protein